MINEDQYLQNQQSLSSIDGVTRSRARDDLNEAINERLDKIELAKANGQFISEEDWDFAIKHGGGPRQRTGGGDFRRLDVIRKEEDNHFKTRQFIESEKTLAIDRQKQVENIQQHFMDNLEMQVLAGNDNPQTIVQTTQAIDKLNQLASINHQVDTNVKQPHLRTEEQINQNQQQINNLKGDLEQQNRNYEHFIQMRDIQRNQDQVARQQQIQSIIQQQPQQTEGMSR